MLESALLGSTLSVLQAKCMGLSMYPSTTTEAISRTIYVVDLHVLDS